MPTAFVSAVQLMDQKGLKRQNRIEILRPLARDPKPCNAVSKKAEPPCSVVPSLFPARVSLRHFHGRSAFLKADIGIDHLLLHSYEQM
ncbi:hypothetical protein AD935_05555 [Gluconobacter japonicus]|nr:hypothetical protein AD935_05555 [Gluconobacter japonicus]